jgi:hypothetical protein
MFGGFQIKISNALYIPIVAGSGYGEFQGKSNELLTKGLTTYPLEARGHLTGLLLYSGLFINTDIIQGGIYAGYKFQNYYRSTRDYLHISGDPEDDETVLEDQKIHGFSMALLPVVPTSDWAVVGKVLNKLFGYIGMGDSTVFYPYSSEEELSNRDKAFLKALNYALDFAFNRIHLDFLTLNANAFYDRGSYDSAARNDK